jgi:hypothetical protein
MRDTRRDLATCFATKQVGLGFSSLPQNLAEKRRQAVHMASSRRSREDEVKDGRVNTTGCIRLFYPYFTVFVVLGHRCILVFLMSL